ncbi:MAG TPA: hypothetical protein VEA40_11310 [Ramlibacter sp.]|nr:hypothetical protein [Ramlibacter sp.]
MNPELRRYAWLELGPHRLLLVPLVLGALAAMPLLTIADPAVPLAWGASGIFVVLTAGWGALRALASVVDEVRDRTWDFQRMAASTPASLAAGKVFGAPLFQWYIGAWCLAVLAIAGAAARLPGLGSLLVGLVAAAVLMHALAVAISAAGARTRMAERARRAIGLVLVLGLLQTLPLGLALQRAEPDTFVRWWGWRLGLDAFAAASLVAFAAWALLAAWRAMLRELQEPARPWPWPAFAAFAALWWAGLSTPTLERASPGDALAMASAVLALGAYVAVLLEPLTRVALARTVRAWRPQAARWQHRVPAWCLHAALAVLVGALARATGSETWPALAFAVACMALRDAAIVGCFAVASSARSPVGRAVFYIVLADLLVPAVAAVVGWTGLARLAFPLLGIASEPGPSAGGMALHALAACAALAVCIGHARRPAP